MANNIEIENFGGVIVNEEDSDNVDDSGSHKKIKRSAKTTPLQYQKLQEFMQTNPDFTQGKADTNQLFAWDQLSADLNEIGPPFHSSIDLRRVWTDFRGSQKRKGNSVIIVQDIQCTGNTAVQPINPSPDCSKDENVYSQLTAMNAKNCKLEIKINTVVEQNAETNRLLKEIFDLLKPQSLSDSNDS